MFRLLSSYLISLMAPILVEQSLKDSMLEAIPKAAIASMLEMNKNDEDQMPPM